MGAGKEITTKDMLKTLKLEALKEYREYDVNNRPSAIYQTLTSARDLDDCLKTEYVYDGLSNRIVKKRETVVDWSSAWDI